MSFEYTNAMRFHDAKVKRIDQLKTALTAAQRDIEELRRALRGEIIYGSKIPKRYIVPENNTWSGGIKKFFDRSNLRSGDTANLPPDIYYNPSRHFVGLRHHALNLERLVAWVINEGYISVRAAAKIMGTQIEEITDKL